MKEVKISLLPSKFGAGPYNLGDPNDKTLRNVEKEVLIPQKMREKVKTEKCTKEVKEFTECCKGSHILMPFKCNVENDALVDCLTRWYQDPGFKEECTEEYLKERSEYRQTGISKQKKSSRMA